MPCRETQYYAIPIIALVPTFVFQFKHRENAFKNIFNSFK